MNTAKTVSHRLAEILEEEYQALTNGDLDGIERLGAAKLEVLQAVQALPPASVAKLEPIREALIRNQLLVQSAIEGMRKAIARAREIGEVAEALKTYRRDGRKSRVAIQMSGKLSKRS